MINEGKKRDASPHAHLGLPGMARRLPQSSDGGVEGHAAPKRAATRPDDRTKGSTAGIKPGPSEMKPKSQRSSVGEPATHNGLDVGSIPAAGTKSKRGRPAKVADDEPWKVEGVSRRTWYRRQKKEPTK